jgi:hypothetical protein
MKVLFFYVFILSLFCLSCNNEKQQSFKPSLNDIALSISFYNKYNSNELEDKYWQLMDAFIKRESTNESISEEEDIALTKFMKLCYASGGVDVRNLFNTLGYNDETDYRTLDIHKVGVDVALIYNEYLISKFFQPAKFLLDSEFVAIYKEADSIISKTNSCRTLPLTEKLDFNDLDEFRALVLNRMLFLKREMCYLGELPSYFSRFHGSTPGYYYEVIQFQVHLHKVVCLENKMIDKLNRYKIENGAIINLLEEDIIAKEINELVIKFEETLSFIANKKTFNDYLNGVNFKKILKSKIRVVELQSFLQMLDLQTRFCYCDTKYSCGEQSGLKPELLNPMMLKVLNLIKKQNQQ